MLGECRWGEGHFGAFGSLGLPRPEQGTQGPLGSSGPPSCRSEEGLHCWPRSQVGRCHQSA